MKNLNTEYSVRRIGGHDIICASRDDLLNICISDIERGVSKPKVVMDVNGHGMSLFKTDLSYKRYVQRSDIIHADGGFIVTISKLTKGAAIPERSATTDMIHDFAKRFASDGKSFYLLGGTEEVNKKCHDELIRLYPGLKISGRRNGYFDESKYDEIIREINDCKPDVLWLGLGKPLEQKVAIDWKNSLKVSWIITCGGCFNYISGDYSRAPLWMQRLNLEWVYRLATNPRKLFVRYALTTPHALFIALRDR